MRGDEFSDAQLRESIAGMTELAGDGDDCPPAERLVLSGRGELKPVDDESVILHIAECTACAAAWRISREVGPQRAPSIHPAARLPLVERTWVRVAAAAAMLLVVTSAGLYFLGPDTEPTTIYRAQEDELLQSLLAEDESLDRNEFILRWSAGPEGTVYDVLITDERMVPLARGLELDRPDFHVSADSLDGVEPGSRVLWQVTARLPDGRRVESKTFFVRLE
jgi:hypothetical protein